MVGAPQGRQALARIGRALQGNGLQEVELRGNF